MYSYGPPHIADQKQDDQHEHTFSNYVRIRDVVQKTCHKVVREGQGFTCYQHDMMTMMMIVIRDSVSLTFCYFLFSNTWHILYLSCNSRGYRMFQFRGLYKLSISYLCRWSERLESDVFSFIPRIMKPLSK